MATGTVTSERLAQAPSSQPSAASPTTYVLPTAILMVGAMYIVVSTFLPYWELRLHAPQYPGGLHIELFVNRVAGDVAEIDGLNHYIGMARLEEAAAFERSLAVLAVGAVGLLLLAATFIQSRWAGLVALPAVLYPTIFLADLYFWLYTFGHDLDPKAALSTSIKPFTPMILGEGRIGQFRTVATLEDGFYLAVLGSLAVLIGLYFHRRAYRPLAEVNDHPASSS
ncbi:MAG: cytochrome C [Chloroflexi bacterium]|nr:cytochrome C [Chloroflexota bacterium]